jgi:acyl-CoA synthetase (AMP-forming)/AMP-acid ligase II
VLLLTLVSQPQEIAHQINDSGASAIFVVPALLPGYEQSRAHQKRPLPNSRVVLLCSTADKPAGSPYKSYEELYGERGHVEHFEGTDAHTTAWLCYSSGTTGLPKGVMTTHYNLTSMMESYNTVGLKHVLGRDTILGILPMSHIFGLLCLLLQPLTRGVPVVVMPRFEEVSVLKAIEKYRITFATFVPPIILVLLHSKERAKYDVSSLQRVMCGAAPLSEELARAFTAAFPGCVL